MRSYSIISKQGKELDLRDYRDIIEMAVLSANSDAIVNVYESNYTVSPSPTKGQAIKTGREICKSDLGKYCIHVPKLFQSVEVEETNDLEEVSKSNDKNSKQPTGGHH